MSSYKGGFLRGSPMRVSRILHVFVEHRERPTEGTTFAVDTPTQRKRAAKAMRDNQIQQAIIWVGEGADTIDTGQVLGVDGDVYVKGRAPLACQDCGRAVGGAEVVRHGNIVVCTKCADENWGG